MRRLAPALLVMLLAALLPPGAAQAAYQDSVLGTSGLVSFWRLGETSGTSAVDAKGLQNATYGSGITLGATGALAGNTDKAVTVDAAGDTISAPDRTQYDLNGFTVEVWLRLSSYGNTATNRRIASKGAARAERNWLIGFPEGTQGQILASYGTTAGGMATLVSPTNLQLNTWYHLAVTHVPGQKLQLFVNGALDTEITDTATPVTSAAPVGFGAADGEFSTGRFDEAALYNRALTAAEIQQHYAAGTDATAPDTAIGSGPASSTTSTSASFAFTSTESGSTFECKLDSGSWAACTSPKAYSALAVGAHTFSVRARDLAGNTDASPASRSWTITAPCTPAFGSFSPPNWPPACWRPFASASPFNREIPPTAMVSGSSSAIVGRILGDLSDLDYPQNLSVPDNGHKGEPTYWSRTTDPLFTINCDTFMCGALQGAQVRIPAGARVEGNSTAGDARLTVIDQSTGNAYDLFGVRTNPIPSAGGTLNVATGGISNVQTGDGRLPADQPGSNAAQLAGFGGRIRAEELAAGTIDHALRIMVPCDNGGAVFPARHSDRSCAEAGGSNVNAPPMGTHLRLNLSDQAIDQLKTVDNEAIPPWRKAIYRAMARYGAFVSDTGTYNTFAFEFEAGSQYTTMGAADRWLSLASSAGMPRNADGDGYVGFFRYDAVDWAGKLEVLDPCVSAASCGAADTTPPETTVTSGPGATLSTTASLSFTANESGATFECRLDAQAFAACTSPKSLSGLTAGSHTFQVRARDAAGNVDASPASWTWKVLSPCVFGDFGPGNWPDACWRPYASTSPFNTPLPAAPKLAARSDEWAALIVGKMSVNDYPGNIIVNDDGGGSGEPTYYSKPADPAFTIHCNPAYACPNVEGRQVRIPAGARTESGSDKHLAVIDQATGEEFDFWGVSANPIPATGGVLNVESAGVARADTGDGRALVTPGPASGATASMFANLAGRVRVEELQAADIQHALNVTLFCDSRSFVYPARKNGQSCIVPNPQPGENSAEVLARNVRIEEALPMGSHLQLNMSDQEINDLRTVDNQPVPPWRKAIYRAMARYGMFFGDTGGDDFFAIEHETGSMYTSMGHADKWAAFAQSAGWRRKSEEDGWVGQFRYDNVPWATRLRVIDPCVSQRTC